MYASIVGHLFWSLRRTSACLNPSPRWAALMAASGILACTTGPDSPAPDFASTEAVAEERLIIPPRDQETGFSSFQSDEINPLQLPPKVRILLSLYFLTQNYGDASRPPVGPP
jgi:hypothetical protein